MNKNNYTPHPIDTKDVALPRELSTLAEDIAKNVHEVWSAGRMKDGWMYGKERNDAEKKHPCLVAYEELSEEEKAYDRNTSIETIKLILKLGFKITKEWRLQGTDSKKAIENLKKFGLSPELTYWTCSQGYDDEMFLLDLESGTIEAYPVGMMGRNTIMPYDFMDVIIVEEVFNKHKDKGC